MDWKQLDEKGKSFDCVTPQTLMRSLSTTRSSAVWVSTGGP
jgi:hypothetical protein